MKQDDVIPRALGQDSEDFNHSFTSNIFTEHLLCARCSFSTEDTVVNK